MRPNTINGKNGSIEIVTDKNDPSFYLTITGSLERAELRRLMFQARKAILELAKEHFPLSNKEDVLAWITASNKADATMYENMNWGYFNEAENGVGTQRDGKTVYDFADTLNEVEAEVNRVQKDMTLAEDLKTEKAEGRKALIDAMVETQSIVYSIHDKNDTNKLLFSAEECFGDSELDILYDAIGEAVQSFNYDRSTKFQKEDIENLLSEKTNSLDVEKINQERLMAEKSEEREAILSEIESKQSVVYSSVDGMMRGYNIDNIFTRKEQKTISRAINAVVGVEGEFTKQELKDFLDNKISSLKGSAVENAMGEIEKVLKGIGLLPEIVEKDNRYKVGDIEYVIQGSLNLPMYQGRLYMEDEGMFIEETVTKASPHKGEILKELYETAQKYGSMNVAIMKDHEDDLVRYMAIGEGGSISDFTGIVYGYVGSGVYDENFMYKGRYIQDEGTDTVLENSDKEAILRAITNDKELVNRCRTLESIFTVGGKNGYTKIKNYLSGDFPPNEMVYPAGKKFDFPSFSNTLNPDFPEVKEHTEESILTQDDLSRVAKNISDKHDSIATARIGLERCGLESVLRPSDFNTIKDMVVENVQNKASLDVKEKPEQNLGAQRPRP